MTALSKDKIFLNIAFSLLLGIFSIFMLSSLGFIFGLSINLCYILIATVLLIFIPFKYYQFNIRETFISLIAVIAIIISAYLISTHIMDFSTDGPWYHQTGILFLKKGWNPIYTSAENFFQHHWNAHINGLVWIDSYPKFFEIFAANIFYLTNNIEAGKMLNFLSLAVLFFYSYHVLGQYLLKKQKYLQVLFSFLLICNPIVWAQICTYYVDGLVYIYFVLMLLSLVDIQQSQTKNKIAYSVLIMSAVLLANLKLGGACYTLFILIIYALCRYFWKGEIKAFGKSCAVILILVLLSGINPYFTNLYKGKHILYPVMGSEKIDIMKHNMPSQFFNKPMPYKLFMSTFSKTDNSLSEFLASDTKIQLKLPFTFYASEIDMLRIFDLRQGGFGIFWSGILLIAAILAFFIKNKEKKKKQVCYFVFCTLILSVLLNPENWWARYVPQFYALPVFVLLFYCISLSSLRRKLITYVVSFIIVVNSSLVVMKIYQQALLFTATKSMQLNNMELIKRNPDMIKNLEREQVRPDFTAPTLLFLDKYSRK